jgi:hypothetical protein
MKRYLIVAIMAVTLFLPYVSATGGEDMEVTLPKPSGKQIFLYTSALDYICELDELSQQGEACRTEAYDTLTSWISNDLKIRSDLRTCPYSDPYKCRKCQNACYSSTPPIPIPPHTKSQCVSWCISNCT